MGIIERKEREKKERRRMIIDAAEKVFFSKGFESATMDEIAEKAELSKGTLYLYFQSKESIYTAITERGLVILSDMFRKVDRDDLTGIERLKKLGEAYFRFAGEYRDYFWALVFYETRKITPETDDKSIIDCARQGEKTLGLLIEAVEKAKNDGTVDSRFDPRSLALLLWGTSLGLVQMSLVKKEFVKSAFQLNMNDIVAQYFELIREAIRPKDIK